MKNKRKNKKIDNIVVENYNYNKDDSAFGVEYRNDLQKIKKQIFSEKLFAIFSCLTYIVSSLLLFFCFEVIFQFTIIGIDYIFNK